MTTNGTIDVAGAPVPLTDQPPFLTVHQASKLLHVSTWAIYQAIRSGELPVIRWGRRVVLQREDLAAFLSAKRDEGALNGPGRQLRSTTPSARRHGPAAALIGGESA